MIVLNTNSQFRVTNCYTPDAAVYYLLELKRKLLLVEIKYIDELIEKRAVLEPKFSSCDIKRFKCVTS